MNRLIISAVVLGGLVLVAASSLFAVHQTQQVLITQFGQPIRVADQPGLNWKVPFIQTGISFDRRLIDFDAQGQEVILGDQRRLVVDTFTRYRITDPLRFYQTVGATENGIRQRLGPIVSSSLRNTLGNEPLLAVLSADRARIMGEIRQRVNAEAQSRAETLRGEGEQQAIRIFAAAYEKDPEFYQFWRTMQAWRDSPSAKASRQACMVRENW